MRFVRDSALNLHESPCRLRMNFDIIFFYDEESVEIWYHVMRICLTLLVPADPSCVHGGIEPRGIKHCVHYLIYRAKLGLLSSLLPVWSINRTLRRDTF